MNHNIRSETVRQIAAQHNIRFVGGSVDAAEQDFNAFVFTLLMVASGMAARYIVWPDGSFCEPDELHEMAHKSDDYAVLFAYEWDANGDPIFPGGLR